MSYSPRRILVVMALFGLVLGLAYGPQYASASGRGPCSSARYDVKPRMGATVVHRKVRHLIGCATGRWHVPGGRSKAVSVAACESNLWPWAHNAGNDGLFQIRDWPAARHSWLRREWFPNWPPGPFKARANAIAAIRWAHASGWSAWACS